MSDVTDNSGPAPYQSHPVIPEDATIILPVRNMLLFPGMVLPLTIGRPASIAAAQEAVRSARKIGLLLQDDPGIEQPGPEHLRRVGTIAEVLRYVTSEQTHYAICRGIRRFRVDEFLPGFPYLVARITEIGISDARTRCAWAAAERAGGDRASHRQPGLANRTRRLCRRHHRYTGPRKAGSAGDI
jgi:ATP-dependent Lon protease